MKKKALHKRDDRDIRHHLGQHLGLKFTDENWVELLALIDGKVRLDVSNRALSAEKVLQECRQLREASQQLSKFLEGPSASGMQWAGFLRGRVIDEGISENEEDLLYDPQWAAKLQHMLRLFGEVSEMVATCHESRVGKAGRTRDLHRRQFAECLSDHFIRAGGTFYAGGPAGFPYFLKCVWELMPSDCRPNTARSFADMLNRLVDKSDRQQTSPSKADYCIRLTRTYWGIPCI